MPPGGPAAIAAQLGAALRQSGGGRLFMYIYIYIYAQVYICITIYIYIYIYIYMYNSLSLSMYRQHNSSRFAVLAFVADRDAILYQYTILATYLILHTQIYHCIVFYHIYIYILFAKQQLLRCPFIRRRWSCGKGPAEIPPRPQKTPPSQNKHGNNDTCRRSPHGGSEKGHPTNRA